MYGLQSKITHVNTPSKSHPMKQKITKAFGQLSSNNQLREVGKKECIDTLIIDGSY